jgi:hypothetical protein
MTKWSLTSRTTRKRVLYELRPRGRDCTVSRGTSIYAVCLCFSSRMTLVVPAQKLKAQSKSGFEPLPGLDIPGFVGVVDSFSGRWKFWMNFHVFWIPTLRETLPEQKSRMYLTLHALGFPCFDRAKPEELLKIFWVHQKQLIRNKNQGCRKDWTPNF